MWNKLAIAASLAATLVGSAYAQQSTTGVGRPLQAQVLNSLPSSSTTVTNYYKQNVYDPSDAKIGEISDVLVGKDGRVEAFIISVAAFSEWAKRTSLFLSRRSAPAKETAHGI